ncbi:Uncharacterised protein [Bordetella pertussis]|nr:Uncharacterised protein [Bordetella pertussis]CFW38487.1 Uncharacterised protein [Bordetella pertussis]
MGRPRRLISSTMKYRYLPARSAMRCTDSGCDA